MRRTRVCGGRVSGCGLFDCLPWKTAVSAAIMFTRHRESKTRGVVLPSGQIALGAVKVPARCRSGGVRSRQPPGLFLGEYLDLLRHHIR